MADTLPLVYGVWLERIGWMRNKKTGQIFSDLRLRYAEEALAMSAPARGKVVVIDDSMIALESWFLEQESKRLG